MCIATKRTESDSIILRNPMEEPINLRNPVQELQVELPRIRPKFHLISESNSPFYNLLGYKVVQTYHKYACLLSVANVYPEHLGRNA